MTQEEMTAIADWLANNRIKKLEEGYAEDALELDKPFFEGDSMPNGSTAWSMYFDRKGG